MSSKVLKSRDNAVVTSLARVSRSSESGQVDRVAPSGGEKENMLPPLILAGLISTASKSRKSERTLTDAAGDYVEMRKARTQ